jgi:hypothetical protein
VKARVTLAAVTLVLVAGVAAGWFIEHRATPASGASSGGGGYHFVVTRAGKQLASYNLSQLGAIPSRKVTLQGAAEEGPQLLEVLKRSGAGAYSSVVVLGAGQKDSGRLVLKASEIGPDTVLDVAKRGTVKIAGPAIPWDKRVRDITEIQVQ